MLNHEAASPRSTHSRGSVSNHSNGKLEEAQAPHSPLKQRIFGSLTSIEGAGSPLASRSNSIASIGSTSRRLLEEIGHDAGNRRFSNASLDREEFYIGTVDRDKREDASVASSVGAMDDVAFRQFAMKQLNNLQSKVQMLEETKSDATTPSMEAEPASPNNLVVEEREKMTRSYLLDELKELKEARRLDYALILDHVREAETENTADPAAVKKELDKILGNHEEIDVVTWFRHIIVGTCIGAGACLLTVKGYLVVAVALVLAAFFILKYEFMKMDTSWSSLRKPLNQWIDKMAAHEAPLHKKLACLEQALENHKIEVSAQEELVHTKLHESAYPDLILRITKAELKSEMLESQLAMTMKQVIQAQESNVGQLAKETSKALDTTLQSVNLFKEDTRSSVSQLASITGSAVSATNQSVKSLADEAVSMSEKVHDGFRTVGVTLKPWGAVTTTYHFKDQKKLSYQSRDPFAMQDLLREADERRDAPSETGSEVPSQRPSQRSVGSNRSANSLKEPLLHVGSNRSTSSLKEPLLHVGSNRSAKSSKEPLLNVDSSHAQQPITSVSGEQLPVRTRRSSQSSRGSSSVDTEEYDSHVRQRAIGEASAHTHGKDHHVRIEQLPV
jgi:hypothetical protein